MENDQLKLLLSIKSLNREQLANFLWIVVARTAPLQTISFLKKSNEWGYLTRLFLSMETCRAFYTFRDFAHTNDIAFDLALNINHTRGLDRILAANISNDCDFPRALATILNHSLDIILESDFINSIEPIIERVFDLAFALCYGSKKYQKFLDLLMEDTFLLREDRNDELDNDISWYGNAWNEWLGTLKELGGSYWADWYVRLFKDRFKILDIEEVKRHLQLPKELWEKELSVSAQWLMKLAQPGAKRLNEARIILLGEAGAGKTSLARRLIDPKAPMPTKEESTVGVVVTNVKLSAMAQGIPSDRDANVHIWDFAGQAITHAVHRFFLSERCVYIIVYDGRTEGRNRPGYWLDHVRNYGGKSRVIVLVNLQGGPNPDIAETYFKERYTDNQCEFIRFSIQDDATKLQRFREKIANIIVDAPAWDQKMPADYYEVKERIEKAFKGGIRNHITRQEFEKAAANVEKGEREGLLRSLTQLGICLWYPEIKGIDLLVLNPEWITRGIYQIFNWLKNSGRSDASIALLEFGQVFKTIENDYPQDKYLFLYQLMQYYELAYKKAYHDQIVVPPCLPEDCPTRAELPDFPQETSLYLEINASKSGSEGSRLTFPPDVLPRFIVRRSEDLRESLIWRYGAVLKNGNVTALIEQEDFLIKLHVKGRERRNYLGELMYTLMAVLNDYPSFASERPEVSCCIAGSNGSKREMIPLIQVINYVKFMEKQNKRTYFDPGRNMDIPLDNAREYLSPKVNNFFVFTNQANIAPDGSVTAKQNN